MPLTNQKKISKKQSLVLALISFIAGFLIFIAAYMGMADKFFIGDFNQPILDWMINHRTTFATNLAQITTSTANPPIFAAVVSTFAIIWAFIKRDLWRPTLLVGSVAIAAATSLVFKSIIMDARPPMIDMIPAYEVDSSFPSGHTIGMAVFLLVLGYLIYSRHYSFKSLVLWISIALAGTGVIALSRLYLGYHWMTDVFASLGLGFIILTFAIIADLFFKSKKIKHQL